MSSFGNHHFHEELMRQRYEELLKEAANERLIRQARAGNNPTPLRKEVKVMLKRRLAIVTTVAIVTALLIAQNVASAVGGAVGGGGINLVM